MGFNKNTTQFKRLLSSNSTLSAFAISAAGNTGNAIPAGVGSIPLVGPLSAVIQFFGEGADNSQFNYQIFTRTQIVDSSGVETGRYNLTYLGGGTVTLSTHTQTTNGTTERFADTITWTPGSGATTIKSSYTAFATVRSEDTGTIHSPADNTPAELLLSSLCNGDDLLIDFDMIDATKGNAQVRFSRL